MAKKSQASGERKLGQMRRSLGYGISQKASHGRPMWQTGMIAPMESAKTVMASAQRVTGRRQVALARRRMAEISVPAWLMPIQKTKLVMSKAQKTGEFRPQTPMPCRPDSKNVHTPASTRQVAKATATQYCVLERNMRPQQVLLNLLRRLFHAITRLVADNSLSATCPSSPSSLVPRFERARRETSLFGSFKSPKTMAFGEQDCTQAGLNSPSFSSRFSPSAWISAALMRCTQNVHFSMMPTLRTETSGLSCRLQRLFPVGIVEIEIAHGVGAGVGAIARADAAIVDLAVQAFVGVIAGVDRADRLAGSVVALLAQHRLKRSLHIGELAFPIALDANPVLGAAARGLILADRGDVVFGVAGNHARLAARAAVQIDHHCPF